MNFRFEKKVMYRYVFEYEPIWGCFTRMVEYVTANNPQQAEIKFFTSKAGDNCARLIRFYRG